MHNAAALEALLKAANSLERDAITDDYSSMLGYLMFRVLHVYMFSACVANQRPR